MQRIRITIGHNPIDPVDDLRKAARIRRDLWAHSPVEIDPDSEAHGTHRDAERNAYFEFATARFSEVERVLREYGYEDQAKLEVVEDGAGTECVNCGTFHRNRSPSVQPVITVTSTRAHTAINQFLGWNISQLVVMFSNARIVITGSDLIFMTHCSTPEDIITSHWCRSAVPRLPPTMPFDEDGHVLITPTELRTLAFSDPDRLINHQLLAGTPVGFPTYASYIQFVDYLTAKTGIHSHHFLFRGSTKIGFSISPNREKKKTWRRFGPGSDLDLAIIDPHFYATIDEQVRRWDRLPSNRENVYRYRTGVDFKQYRNRVDQKGRHDCYRYFDLPRELASFVELEEVLKNAPISDCCVHPFVEFKAFIFRDRWAVHRRYHTDLDELRRGLTARENPLPQPPSDPFPAETI